MKKNFLFVMATAAIFASCSNSEIIDEKQVVNPPVVVDPDGRVEVALGATNPDIVVTPASRGVVEGWKNTPIVVWGLDKAVGADWTVTGSVLMTAAKGTVADANGIITFGTKDAPQRYYYPMNSKVNYSFYACSPDPNVTPQIGTNYVNAIYDIAGNTDILWGIAEIVGEGYNASYFRNTINAEAPKLAFEHVLTQLEFVVTRKNDQGPVGMTEPIQVESVLVSQVPSQLTLMVAGQNKKSLSANAQKADFSLFAGDNVVQYPIVPTIGTDTKLGTVMLMPTSSYTLKVKLGNGSYSQIVDVPVTMNEGFKAGKAYKLQLLVNNIYEVKFGEASIKPWEKSGQVDVVVPIE